MAKILLITQFFPPESNAGARRLEAMASVLSKKHDVCVVTPYPGYPASVLYRHHDVNEMDGQFFGQVVRSIPFQPHHPNLFVRGIRETGMALRLTQKGAFRQADIIIVSTPSMFLVPFSWILARLKGAIFICDLRDLTWRYIRETAKLSKINTKVSIILEKFMLFFLRSCELVISATPGITDILINDYKIQKDKIITIMNGVSREILDLGKKPTNYSSMKLPTVTYIGLFGHNHGIDIMLDVAKRMPSVKFLMIGDGPAKINIMERISHEIIGNLTVVEYISSAKELSKYYYQSTILFSHIKNTPVMNSTAIPAKIFEYMAFRKPIIYAGEGIAIDFLKKIGCALTIPPGNVEEITASISTLLDNPNMMEQMGEKGRAFVEDKYQREVLMYQLVTALEMQFDIIAENI